MYWDDYYEPSEFDIQIEEWKDILRKSVKEEFQNQMEKLKKENTELQDIKEKWEEKVKELDDVKKEYEIKIQNAGRDAKKLRLHEILSPFSQTAYAVQYNYRYIKDKCDKCDDERYIHYKSPSGREEKEQCSCARKKCFYYPIEIEVADFKQLCHPNGKPKNEPHAYYQYKRDGSSSGEYTDEYCYTEHIYQGENFEEINSWWGIVFLNKEDCENYCEYMNNKQ